MDIIALQGEGRRGFGENVLVRLVEQGDEAPRRLQPEGP